MTSPQAWRNDAMRLANLLVASLLIFIGGCAGKKEPGPFQPHENLLSITSEFLLSTPPDPYREAPGDDLLGFNAARSTLARLRNYAEVYPQRFVPERLAVQARALEYLGELDGALSTYEEVATYDSDLAEEASRRISVLEQFLVISSLTSEGEGLLAAVESLAEQSREFQKLARRLDDDFYEGLALKEAENAEILRAEFLATNKMIIPDGEEQAIVALRQLVESHRESQRALEHVYRLARFHRSLAEEEVRLAAPEGLGFDSKRFREHYEQASSLLYRLSQADGSYLKPVAARELDALLALGEAVSDRAR